MAAIPMPEHTTAQAVVRWREQTTDTGHRPHLGASVIGHPCDRHLWLLFRWAGAEKFDGRMLRLFDTGRREEPRVIEELRGVGCEVHADDGTGQYRVSDVGEHFGGSMDGVVRGLVEAPKAWHVLEVKTFSEKMFAELLKKTVRQAKPMHWKQMQAYMHLSGIDRALYYAVNKNTDAVYLERVEYDKAEGEAIVERARRVIEASEPPMRLSEDPAWFECKWCRFHAQCHGTEAPEVNCRTCVNSTPDTSRGDATWTCSAGTGKPLVTIPVHHQRVGCDMHLFIPPMLERIGSPIDSTECSVTYRMADGSTFTNGPAPGFSSAEIRTCEHKTMLGDGRVQSVKAEFTQARVVA